MGHDICPLCVQVTGRIIIIHLLHQVFSYRTFFLSGLCVLMSVQNSCFVKCFALTQAETVPGPYVWSLVILSCSIPIILSNTGTSTMFMSTPTGTITASPLGGSLFAFLCVQTLIKIIYIIWGKIFFFFFFLNLVEYI